MRIRKQDADGDYMIGHGVDDFYVNVPDAPALLAVYRLRMAQGEWFLNTAEGTPWQTKVIGRNTESSRDPVVRARILGTLGVTAIANYSSDLSRETRAFSVAVNLNTAYNASPAPIVVNFGAV